MKKERRGVLEVEGDDCKDMGTEVKAVVGTNAWGDALYDKMLRGSYVEEDVIRAAVQTAIDEDIAIFDTARDYGLGKGQPMVGRLCGKNTLISAKYTPGTKYKAGQVRASFEKDLHDFGRESVDVYWLHLPNSIQENLSEMIELYREGKIRHIGVSNFNLEECKLARQILLDAGIDLYGVQNHFSLLDRKWEKEGLVRWCRENGISFWAWAVLEEGMLVPPKKTEKKTIMKILFGRKRRKLYPLYRVMREIGKTHHLSIPQVAMCYVSSKGIVPVCGCRKSYQVKELAEAVKVPLGAEELEKLEKAADKTGVKILGADMFRFAVKKGDRETRYKDLTIREFTKAADVYESGHAGIYEMCKDDYPFIAGELAKEKYTDLLDCGCGTGPMISLLYEEDPAKHYTGLDITPRMIEVAKAKNLTGVSWVVGDCENLPFEDNMFDAVICSNSFHHYPNPQKFFDSVQRVLRPGGRLILQDYTAPGPILWLMNHTEMPLANLIGHGDVGAYSLDEVRDFCRKSSLQVEKLESGKKFRLHLVARKKKT